MKGFTILILVFCSFCLQSQEVLNSAGKRLILNDDGLLYFSTSITDKVNVLTYKENNSANKSKDNFICTLAPINISSTKYITDEWSNFDIFGEFNFNIVVNNKHLSGLEQRRLIPKNQGQKLYFECRSRFDDVLKDAGSYSPDVNSLNLDNYENISKWDSPIINYDFIVENNSIFLFVHLLEELYIYEIEDVTKLPFAKWNTIHCFQPPFQQEYFIITKSRTGMYIIHTKTQGEFELLNFVSNPKIIKINNKTLDNRVFITDKESGKTHELSEGQLKSLISSGDHINELQSIITSKNEKSSHNSINFLTFYKSFR